MKLFSNTSRRHTSGLNYPLGIAVLGFLLISGFSARVLADVRILGSHPGVLDRMGAGIAELGAGNTGTARMTANPASYWNPAILAFKKDKMVGVGADNRSLERNGGYLSLEGRAAPNMGIGLSLVNRGDFDVPNYSADEERLGTLQPQNFATYLGIGVKSSRKNSFGASVQWFQENRDLDGLADVNVVGLFNFGWYRMWNKKFHSAVVLRNIGLNSDLTALYEYRSGIGSSEAELDATSEDFYPKTLVVAGMYRFDMLERNADVYAEFLDFQLDPVFFDFDRDHHVQAYRFGVEWQFKSNSMVRTGVDRGNLNVGFGYNFNIAKGHEMILDYAVVLERFGMTINILIFGLQYKI